MWKVHIVIKVVVVHSSMWHDIVLVMLELIQDSVAVFDVATARQLGNVRASVVICGLVHSRALL